MSPAVSAAVAPPGPFVDAYHRVRTPTPSELLAELKNTAWTCASLNAAACATYPPRLYVSTRSGQPAPRCLTRALDAPALRRLQTAAHLTPHTRASVRIEEVTEHPLLDLLRQVNPAHNAFDLWELTTLYQEVFGSAYWLIENGPLGVPVAIWPLPTQFVGMRRSANGNALVDAYIYRPLGQEYDFRPDEIIHFRYPDPNSPYTAGLSPLRACWEQVALASQFTAFKRAKFENHAIPDALISPAAVLGEEERHRLELMWNERLRKGGTGRVVVAEADVRVQLLAHTMGDLAALADLRATREEIANAFHVPLSFLSTETNLANLQAAEHQHSAHAIAPRIRRRDEKLNEQLVPRFDPSGRLFLASDDPVPINREQTVREREVYLKFGVLTINEVRSQDGLPPVAWGDAPWTPPAGNKT
jgi:HK97 family phage portal protein